MYHKALQLHLVWVEAVSVEQLQAIALYGYSYSTNHLRHSILQLSSIVCGVNFWWFLLICYFHSITYTCALDVFQCCWVRSWCAFVFRAIQKAEGLRAANTISFIYALQSPVPRPKSFINTALTVLLPNGYDRVSLPARHAQREYLYI